MSAQIGEYWTLDNTFVMEIIAIKNGVSSLSTVDMRNGSVGTTNKMITDFDRLEVLRKATADEIAKYNEVKDGKLR